MSPSINIRYQTTYSFVEVMIDSYNQGNNGHKRMVAVSITEWDQIRELSKLLQPNLSRATHDIPNNNAKTYPAVFCPIISYAREPQRLKFNCFQQRTNAMHLCINERLITLKFLDSAAEVTARSKSSS